MAKGKLSHDTEGSSQLRADDLHDQNKGALEDTGDREGDDEPEEDEHDVVGREGGDDGADDLDETGHQNAGAAAELVTGPAPEETTHEDSTHVAALDCGEQRRPVTHQVPVTHDGLPHVLGKGPGGAAHQVGGPGTQGRLVVHDVVGGGT